MNQKERIIGFIYVFLTFALTTAICCLLLFYYNSDYTGFSQKDFAIAKMERIKEYQDIQAQLNTSIDSLYNKIDRFNPSINAVYEENDIRFMINELRNEYEKHSWDIRYKSFLHVSDFYYMWFIDKKELWTKQDNVGRLRKNLEECEIGLSNKKNDLNASIRK